MASVTHFKDRKPSFGKSQMATIIRASNGEQFSPETEVQTVKPPSELKLLLMFREYA